MKSINVNTEVVYEYPDSFQHQQWTLRNDQNIELEEFPDYENPLSLSQQPYIQLVECPAYGQSRRT